MKINNGLPATLITLALCGTTNTVNAELSANAGFVSEYYYRGILQKESSASAGLDFEQSGFFIGTWSADVDDGLEVDIYTGYGHEFDNGLSLGIGVTGYYYTGEFDDTYEEVNLSISWGPISIGYSIGEYDNFSGPTQDYDFVDISAKHNGFYITYGSFGDDFDGDYFELGYETEVGEFDASISAIFNSEEISDQCDSAGRDINGSCINTTSGEALIFGISKTFDL